VSEPSIDEHADADIATCDERPRRRSECAEGPRPCPWITCRHHLAFDIDPKSGALKLNHPGLEPWEIPETCSLDVADRGETGVLELATLLNVSRTRIDQILILGMRSMRRHHRNLPR